jgi:hypothetical protein
MNVCLQRYYNNSLEHTPSVSIERRKQRFQLGQSPGSLSLSTILSFIRKLLDYVLVDTTINYRRRSIRFKIRLPKLISIKVVGSKRVQEIAARQHYFCPACGKYKKCSKCFRVAIQDRLAMTTTLRGKAHRHGPSVLALRERQDRRGRLPGTRCLGHARPWCSLAAVFGLA